MRIIYKATSTVLALFFLSTGSFCLVECAFASEEHDHSARVNDAADHHHGSEENQQRSDTEKHDAASSCCSSLVAVQSPSYDLTSIKLAMNVFFNFTTQERLVHQEDDRSKYKVEFSPGTSPPRVFLLSHFTHAPPVSL